MWVRIWSWLPPELIWVNVSRERLDRLISGPGNSFALILFLLERYIFFYCQKKIGTWMLSLKYCILPVNSKPSYFFMVFKIDFYPQKVIKCCFKLVLELVLDRSVGLLSILVLWMLPSSILVFWGGWDKTFWSGFSVLCLHCKWSFHLENRDFRHSLFCLWRPKPLDLVRGRILDSLHFWNQCYIVNFGLDFETYS